MRMEFKEHNRIYTEVYGALLEVYEKRDSGELTKPKLLIEHEARQLAALRLDIVGGIRSLFVTADNRLLRLLQRDERLRDVAGAAMSQLGLVALIDLLVGDVVDNRGLAKMVWGFPVTEEAARVREYFIALALRKMNVAMAMELKGVVEVVATEAARDAEQQEIDLFGEGSAKEAKRTQRFLEMYEDQFFANMRKAIEHREKEQRGG